MNITKDRPVCCIAEKSVVILFSFLALIILKDSIKDGRLEAAAVSVSVLLHFFLFGTFSDLLRYSIFSFFLFFFY